MKIAPKLFVNPGLPFFAHQAHNQHVRFPLEVHMRAILGHLGLMPLAKPLTTEEGRKVLERDHYRCRYCGLDGRSNFDNSLVMSVDFILPRAQKGAKDADNLVCACRACNLIKGKKLFKNFEEAKSHVEKRRLELQKDWETRMARIPGDHMAASG